MPLLERNRTKTIDENGKTNAQLQIPARPAAAPTGRFFHGTRGRGRVSEANRGRGTRPLSSKVLVQALFAGLFGFRGGSGNGLLAKSVSSLSPGSLPPSPELRRASRSPTSLAEERGGAAKAPLLRPPFACFVASQRSNTVQRPPSRGTGRFGTTRPEPKR